MQVNIIINDKVKIGIFFKSSEDVSRVISKLRIEGILPQELNIKDIKILDCNRNFIGLNDTIEKLAMLGTEIPKLILEIPQKFVSSKMLEKNGSEIKMGQQRQTLDKLFKTMKKVFACIQQKKFQEIQKLRTAQTKNPELIEIFCSYSNEFQKYWTLSRVYENLIDKFILGNVKNPEEDKSVVQRISGLGAVQKREATQRLEALSKRISTISSEEDELSRQILQLRSKLKQAEKQLTEYKGNLKNMQFDRQQMQFRMDNKDETIVRKSNQIQGLKSQIEGLNIQLNIQRGEIQTLKQKIQQKGLNEDENFIKWEEMKRQIDFKEAQILQLTGKEASFLKKLKAKQEYKTNLNLIVQSNQIKLFFDLPFVFVDSLFSQIERRKQKRIKQVRMMYRYSDQQKNIWRDQINCKSDILLVAKTVEKKIIGGFSSSCIDLARRGYTNKQFLDTKGFIFSRIEQEFVYFDLKKKHPSIESDSDYIVFGNQQICIQKSGNELSSIFMNLPIKSLHYQDLTKKRSQFISDTDANIKSIQLQSYLILTIEFLDK